MKVLRSGPQAVVPFERPHTYFSKGYWRLRQFARSHLPMPLRQRLKADWFKLVKGWLEISEWNEQLLQAVLNKVSFAGLVAGWSWRFLTGQQNCYREPHLFVTLDLENSATPPVTASAGQHVIALIRLHGIPMEQLYLGKGPRSWSYAQLRTLALSRFYLRLNVSLHLAEDNLELEQLALTPVALAPCIQKSQAQTGESWPPVSIIIPTRNRPKSLEQLLKSLQKLRYPGPYEIIVVDNKPDDERTARLVAAFKDVTYLCEAHALGSWAARNTGLNRAKGEVIVFTDDDTRVEPGWLSAIVETFLSDPQIMAVTGPAYPAELETEAQVIFESHARFNHGEWPRTFSLTEPENGSYLPGGVSWVGPGCNMAFRRKVFEEVGVFDTLLDRQTPARTGGDNDLFYRLLRAGHKIVYQPKAMLYHYHRREREQLKAQLRHYGRGRTALATKIALNDPLMRTRALRFLLYWVGWHQPLLWLSGQFPRDLIWAEWSQNFLGIPGYLLARWQRPQN